jgi:hypothetical protein
MQRQAGPWTESAFDLSAAQPLRVAFACDRGEGLGELMLFERLFCPCV